MDEQTNEQKTPHITVKYADPPPVMFDDKGNYVFMPKTLTAAFQAFLGFNVATDQNTMMFYKQKLREIGLDITIDGMVPVPKE